MKLCFILRYLKILVAFFLFEFTSTLPTSLSPLKEHEMRLFLVHILFVCFFWFSLVLLCSGLGSFSLVFWCTWYGKWIDGFIGRRGMVLGWFLGNTLADMYANCRKCEAINTSSVCFPEDTNISRIAERLDGSLSNHYQSRFSCISCTVPYVGVHSEVPLAKA